MFSWAYWGVTPASTSWVSSSKCALYHHTTSFYRTGKGKKLSGELGRVAHLFANPLVLPDILVVLGENVVDLLNRRDLLLASLVGEGGISEGPACLLKAIKVLLDPLDVLETELGGDDVHVTARVDVALDVDDLGVVKGADDLEDTVDGADVREEGVSETSTC